MLVTAILVICAVALIYYAIEKHVTMPGPFKPVVLILLLAAAALYVVWPQNANGVLPRGVTWPSGHGIAIGSFERREMRLGLDLQGGSQLLLEVDQNELIASQAKALLAGGAVGRNPDAAGIVGFILRWAIPYSVDLNNPTYVSLVVVVVVACFGLARLVATVVVFVVAYLVGFAGFAYFWRNRSTRPAVSISFCLPVKKGWHWEQMSRWISCCVERVSNEFPQAQMTLAVAYTGWMSAFMVMCGKGRAN